MSAAGTWSDELGDVVRGAAGGMLFGIPLLYTMEVWWIGAATRPEPALGVLLFSLLPVYLLTRTSGFRESRDVRFRDAAADTVEAVALGVVCVTIVLTLLRELGTTTPLGEALGKIAYEALPFSLGVAVARHVLMQSRTAGDDGDASGAGSRDPFSATVADIGATLIGATFVAFNIAPTDEIPMLAAATSPWWLLAVIAASLVISYGIVFEAGFANQEQRRGQQGVLQHPVTETVTSYLTALVACAVMLLLFQRFSLSDPWQMSLSYVLMLGLPAAVGGAAGRLAV